MRRLWAAVLVALIATGPAAAPGWAHEDPTLVSRLTEVRPALPAQVLVQVRSEQMVVANPTATPLTVLDPEGAEFLRISSAGVFGNLTAAYLHATANPPEVVPRIPAQARPGAEPQWVPLSQGDTWSWFERRLHPQVPESPDMPGVPDGDSGSRPQVLASWQIGLRYGDQPVTVAGVLERRPMTGTFRATSDPRDDQLTVQIGQGVLPAVQLQVPSGRPVTVGGLDGLPFLRLDDAGVAANPASAHFRDNPQFADLPTGPDGWVRVAAASPMIWLDSRLRYPADRPPDTVATGHQVVELQRWTIPLTVDGEPRILTGSIEWIPSTAVPGTAPTSGIPWITVGLGIAAAALLATLIALRRRSSRGSRTSPAP
jgi:hypothetical protein